MLHIIYLGTMCTVQVSTIHGLVCQRRAKCYLGVVYLQHNSEDLSVQPSICPFVCVGCLCSVLYADNTTVYVTYKNPRFLIDSMKHDLNVLLMNSLFIRSHAFDLLSDSTHVSHFRAIQFTQKLNRII